MTRKTTSRGAAIAPEGIQAEFVRAAGLHQTWVSLSTSREFDVAERHSALPASFLEPGDLGLIVYSTATAAPRSTAVVPRDRHADRVSDAISWVRAAIAELGCGAPAEDLEVLAVTRMAATLHATDRRALAQSIGEACTRLDRHRRASGTSGTRHTP